MSLRQMMNQTREVLDGTKPLNKNIMNVEQRIDKKAREMFDLSYFKLTQISSKLDVLAAALAEAVNEIERLKSKSP